MDRALQIIAILEVESTTFPRIKVLLPMFGRELLIKPSWELLAEVMLPTF